MEIFKLLFEIIEILAEAIFYGGWIVFLLWELGIAVDTNTAVRIFNVRDGHVMAEGPDEEKAAKFTKTILSWYMVWTMTGIFSSHWYVCIAILLLSVALGIFKNNKPANLAFERFDALVCASLILFMLLNKYHFHLQLF